MRAAVRTSRVWTWGAVAALTLGMVGVAIPANAAPPASSNAPRVTVTAESPVDDTVTVRYEVNRGAKQIGQVVCTLDGEATACGIQEPPSKKSTSYSAGLAGLEDGVHVFAVAFTLTDGGAASAQVEFTIDTAPSLDEVCASIAGGTVTRGGVWEWTCAANPYTGPFVPLLDAITLMYGGKDTLAPFCLGREIRLDGTADTAQGLIDVTYSCPYPG